MVRSGHGQQFRFAAPRGAIGTCPARQERPQACLGRSDELPDPHFALAELPRHDGLAFGGEQVAGGHGQGRKGQGQPGPIVGLGQQELRCRLCRQQGFEPMNRVAEGGPDLPTSFLSQAIVSIGDSFKCANAVANSGANIPTQCGMGRPGEACPPTPDRPGQPIPANGRCRCHESPTNLLVFTPQAGISTHPRRAAAQVDPRAGR